MISFVLGPSVIVLNIMLITFLNPAWSAKDSSLLMLIILYNNKQTKLHFFYRVGYAIGAGLLVM